MNANYLRARRIVDRALAAAALVVLSPLLGAIALAVRVRMGSPVMFHQERVGEGGRSFLIRKFRTMVHDADRIGGGYQPPELDLIPPLGRLLRSTSLDELPQLINIARGEMAFIGPRPAIPSQYARYTDEQRGRVAVPQGVTGLAQVRYRDSAPWSTRIEADLDYAEALGPRMDAAILLATVQVVLTRRGVDLHATRDAVDDLAPPPGGAPLL